jgi:hypothetical protein
LNIFCFNYLRSAVKPFRGAELTPGEGEPQFFAELPVLQKHGQLIFSSG